MKPSVRLAAVRGGIVIQPSLPIFPVPMARHHRLVKSVHQFEVALPSCLRALAAKGHREHRRGTADRRAGDRMVEHALEERALGSDIAAWPRLPKSLATGLRLIGNR
ncbi:MAG: hypothetical protein KGY48_09120 [Wenzhouxiangellaceae bacterium]|nr:hypothetical protein [Wenzhouxiangellaceae bacterium]MBS3746451.1 hypothetical protein [Wenzhouxiangellaceae bacterium]